STLYAENNSRNSFLAILFTFLLSLAVFSGVFELNNGATLTIPFILLYFIIFPIIGIFSFRQFLWLIKGKQKLIVNGTDLILKKEGIYFSKPRQFNLIDIRNVR